MVSVERLRQYSDIPQEALMTAGGGICPGYDRLIASSRSECGPGGRGQGQVTISR